MKTDTMSRNDLSPEAMLALNNRLATLLDALSSHDCHIPEDMREHLADQVITYKTMVLDMLHGTLPKSSAMAVSAINLAIDFCQIIESEIKTPQT